MIAHLKKLIKENEKLNKYDIEIEVQANNVIKLTGVVDNWEEVVEFGHLAASLDSVKGVINNIDTAEKKKTTIEAEIVNEKLIKKTDVLIVGAGVTGSAIARELSRYELDIVVIDKNSDLAEGTTKANNGMIHSGYAATPGSLKAELNVKGNAKYDRWAEELNFDLDRTGSLVVGFSEEDKKHIEKYYEKGKKNNVPGIEILSGEEARELEPNLSDKVSSALWTPSAAYVAPYEVTVALAENAVENGVEFKLETKLTAVDNQNGEINKVYTDQGVIECKYLINAAGVYADQVAELAGDRQFSIHPRRGSLIIFDKEKSDVLTRAVGTTPSEHTKGGVAQLTPEGNPLWGPTAVEVAEKNNKAVSQKDIDTIMEKFTSIVDGIDHNDIITIFSGVRAANYKEDFVIEASQKIKGLIQAAAIQSPGLASSPAIAEKVVEILLNEEEKLNLLNKEIRKKDNFKAERNIPKAFHKASYQEKEELFKQNSAYGHLVCRCEKVTEAEIVNAVHSNIAATTMDAVKRRTRAGMGRCQGGFCGPRVIKILARELNKEVTEITKKGRTSNIVKFKIKEIFKKGKA
ncbi:FAD-dependent oxidoreductase [Halanaerobium sp. Z-7514]|uniref:FAD-dependent oxidoreductase n=1 Tax=Halanaerobium polyolivorans TaxID=2886943 RepID=A0AAW4X1I4_9FIRM|nr:FAD-dependent oxidoreductase [Halanaerobium polyolivorans]MCC3145619.1 FAD-dependent oxidoreductase [Halanaerobium polyolivorans]